MKRIIIILWAMTLAVSTFAQGVLKDSIQGDPHIEGLFEYAKSLGFHISENYHFHRLPNKFEKDCLLHVQLYDISEAAPTGNAEEDRKNKEEDERYRGSNKANLLLIDSIRNTFMALAPHASEIYMKEFHLENQDTMLYAMRSGVPADPRWRKSLHDTFRYTSTGSHRAILDVPEQLLFEYAPNMFYQKDKEAGDRISVSQSGSLSFLVRKESHNPNPPEFVDKKVMGKMLGKVLNRKGVTKHQLYVRKDESYTVSRDKDSWDIGMVMQGEKWSSTTKAMVYTIKDKDLANEVMHGLHDVVAQYINEHPNTICDRYDMKYDNYDIFVSQSELKNEYKDKYLVLSRYDSKEKVQRFLIIEAHMSRFGTEYMPSGWAHLKSWVNGEKKYYKGKE